MSNKNLVAFDLETTGLNKDVDQIIQFAGVKIDVSTFEVVDEMNMYIQPISPYTISLQGYFKHGISPQMLNGKPSFKDVATKIVEWMSGCDILTYNGMSFDIPFFMKECERNGIECNIFKVDGSIKYYDAYIEEQRRHSNTLEGTYERYVGKTMAENGLDAHNALADVIATMEVFKHQNEEEKVNDEKMYGYDNVVKDMNFKGINTPCMNYGKYKQIPLSIIQKIDSKYLAWAISNSSGFSVQTKEYLKGYLAK